MSKIAPPLLPSSQTLPGGLGADVQTASPRGRKPTVPAKKIIRELGLKVTQQRLDILDVVRSGPNQFTAQDVFETVEKRNPEIGFATVYRFLRTLTEASFVTEVRMGGMPARYEWAARDHHDHLTCTTCGKIVEFENVENVAAVVGGIEIRRNRSRRLTKLPFEDTNLMKRILSIYLLAFATTAAAQTPVGSPKGEPTNAAEATAQKAQADAVVEESYQALVAKLPPHQQAWERVLQSQLGSFYLQLHKRDKIAGRSNAWDFVPDDPKLPKGEPLPEFPLTNPKHTAVPLTPDKKSIVADSTPGRTEKPPTSARCWLSRWWTG